ncbi:MAG: DUF349 domain-containing protein [Gammaproteobacteria bacterium]|nr:DUF349 domain-containing protein [Gammaproteobacteria bacterium]
MVLNKILKPLLIPFSKEKWQSRNLEVRKKAVQELAVSDQETLNQIAMNDPDETIRAIAANKLSDLDLLQTIIMKGTNESVKQAAQNRLFQLLSGIKHPVPEYTVREKMIRGSRNSALLEYVAANADVPTLREITIKKISRDPLLGDISLTDSNAQVRQLAAQQIAKRSTLERVAKNSRRKDKRVYKIVKAKLDRIIEDEERPLLLAKEVVDICDKLEKLYKRNRLLQEKTTFENYVARWSEIQNFANEETTERYHAICSDIIGRLDKLEQQQQNEQETVQILTSFLSSLSDAVDELLVARETDAPDQQKTEQHETIILNLGREWDEVIKSLTSQEKIDLYNSKFQAILDLADAKTAPYVSRNSLQKIHNLVEQTENMLVKSGYILEKTISALQDKFNQQIEITDCHTPEIEQNQQQFSTAIHTLKDKLRVQQKNADAFKDQIDSRTEKIKSRIAEGQVSKADKTLHELLKQIDKSDYLSKSEKQNYHIRLKQFQSELGDLSSWRNWAHDNERENLVHQAEEIAQQAQKSKDLSLEFNEIMSQVKELRQQWKKMRSHTPEELWQHFNNACNQAYELCTPFIKQQSAIRQANLEAKQGLCDQLEQYITSMGWPSKKDTAIDTSIDWIQVDKITKQARKEWSAIGFIDRKDHKAINNRFNKAIETIRNELKNVWQHNQDQFFNLIHKVQSLHETLDADLPGAIQQAKEYQKHWKQIGPVSSFQRNKLWKKFRSACDVIFNKRQESLEQKDAENKERLREKQAICENLVALNQQPLSQKDLENAFNDIQKLWQELMPQVKTLSKEVNKEYAEAVEVYQDKFNAVIVHEQEQQLELIKQKADVCTRIESSLDITDENISQLQEQFRKEWQNFTSLPHALEARLNIRFENALQSVQADKEALRLTEREKKQQFCLKYEIFLGKDSPLEEQQTRMEMQVELLNSNLGQNRAEDSSANQTSPFELQLQWYEMSNYTQDNALDKRFMNLLADTEG